MTIAEHYTVQFDQDEEDWWWVRCICTWESGPFPGPDDAADAYGDHRADTA